MTAEDPRAVLGLGPDAGPEEVARAYRRLAKRWHPDHSADPRAAEHMARINAAYAQLQESVAPGGGGPRPPPRPRRRPGAWLPEEVRRALGPELLTALQPREPVGPLARASTWASSSTLLVATDRRLLWLLDDVVQGRVRSLPYTSVLGIEHRTRPWRRHRAEVRVRRIGRRRALAFAGLDPDAARAIALHVTLRLPAARRAGR